MNNKRSFKFYRQNEAEVMESLGLKPTKNSRKEEANETVKSTGRNIIFVWEHEINDDWFWIGDYLGGDAI